LQFGVQAAAPLKDSGNDLIALKGRVVKSIQVKTRTSGQFDKNNLPEIYDILALVHLAGGDHKIELDRSKVYLVPSKEVPNIRFDSETLSNYEVSLEWVNSLFSGNIL
jgi:hypothetical protein